MARLVALAASLGLCVVCVGCPLRLPGSEEERLAVSELTVDFPEEGSGDLWFAVNVPLEAGMAVGSATWDLWLGAKRFATGIERAPQVSPLGGGVARVSVHAPLRYRHLVYQPGAAFVDTALSGELSITGIRGASKVKFAGRREILTRGVPEAETQQP